MTGPLSQQSSTYRRRFAHLRVVGFFLVGIAALILIRLFVVDLVAVEGRSMEPTIAAGRVVIVNKLAYGLRRPLHYGYLVRWAEPRTGDIVVVRHPVTGTLLVKRATVTSGNRLPPGTVMVMGDNPEHSVDSRRFGPVSLNLVGGRVEGIH